MFCFLASASSEIESEVEDLTDKVGKLAEMTDGLLDKIIAFAFNLLIAVVIFIVGRLILKGLRRLLRRILEKSKVDEGVVRFADSVAMILGYLVLIIVICAQIGIQTTSLITLLGTVGLSIGLAIEGCLSNFAGGVLILVTRPFKLGDYIMVNESEGTVAKIDIIYTTLHTTDNKSIKLPNGIVSNSVLTNFTREEKRRVDLDVGVQYDDDIKLAKDTALITMNECPYILKDEDNKVVVKELSQSCITLGIRMWTATDDYWDCMFYMNENIKEAFEKRGIHIPYNQLDVHIKENK